MTFLSHARRPSPTRTAVPTQPIRFVDPPPVAPWVLIATVSCEFRPVDEVQNWTPILFDRFYFGRKCGKFLVAIVVPPLKIDYFKNTPWFYVLEVATRCSGSFKISNFQAIFMEEQTFEHCLRSYGCLSLFNDYLTTKIFWTFLKCSFSRFIPYALVLWDFSSISVLAQSLLKFLIFSNAFWSTLRKSATLGADSGSASQTLSNGVVVPSIECIFGQYSHWLTWLAVICWRVPTS